MHILKLWIFLSKKKLTEKLKNLIKNVFIQPEQIFYNRGYLLKRSDYLIKKETLIHIYIPVYTWIDHKM